MTRLTGGCACGAVRYEATGEPAAQLHCQCIHCRQRSGTGHSSYVVYGDRGQVSLQGEAKAWSVRGDSGNEKLHAFCPTCGAPVYVTFPENPTVIALHAGSLDAPEHFQPAFVTYGVRGQAWDRMADGLKIFEKMPQG